MRRLPALAHLPHTPGVYRFRDARAQTLYIGRAVDLRRRAGSYWNARDGTRLARLVACIARVEALECASEHEASWLERNLLEQSLPRWNKTAGGQEVPVFLRVCHAAAMPSVTVVHDVLEAPSTLHFGPYLGGFKVRLASAALHRALPLAYAGAALSGADRDMARARGVSAADRQALLDTLCRALRREAPAVVSVRQALCAQRDRASAALAFERAAEIQAELVALEWVVSVQRVTVAEPVDADVCGWAGGTLVQFEVRGGRLSRWRQRSCSAAAARRRVAATPAAWLEFAQRNAELAARLSTA